MRLLLSPKIEKKSFKIEAKKFVLTFLIGSARKFKLKQTHLNFLNGGAECDDEDWFEKCLIANFFNIPK